MKSISIVLFFFTLNSLATTGLEHIEQNESEAETAQEQTAPKENILKSARVEVMLNSFSGANGVAAGWIVSPQIIISLFTQSRDTRSSQQGGDLDNGQYFATTSGYNGRSVLLGGKYYFKKEGFQKKGWFTGAQVGRSWGKYELSTDRYERDNGWLGNTFFGIDKKIAESDSAVKIADTEIARIGIGYAIPWIDGNLLKGVSVQFEGGFEHNSITDNQTLSTKFGTKNVGADLKHTVYGHIGLGAYF
jgi:hypothetical protein